MCGLRPNWIRYDRTARGWHIIIRVNRRLSGLECVALQAVLGSDSARETFNLARVMSRSGGSANKKRKAWEAKRWNILYRVKLKK